MPVTDRRIRVLHLLSSMTGQGCGIVNAAIDIISGQLKEPMDIAVCANGGAMLRLLDSADVQQFTLNQNREAFNLIRAAIQLRHIIREFQPDIIHTHMITSTLLARAVSIGCSHRIVAHLHNVHQRSALLMASADRVIAVSEAVKLDLVEHGVSPRRIRVVHNGPLGSLRLSTPESTVAKDLCQPAIVTVAGMNHRKGISELIAAFEIVCRSQNTCHLYLVGNGPERAEFEAKAMASSVADRIHFEGFQADPNPYMKAASVFVLASRRDSFGLVLTEARQYGRPIVATAVDGIPEALDGGRAGILVPPRNPDVLASAILDVLEKPSQAIALGNRALENLEAFRVEGVASKLTAVYSELLYGAKPIKKNVSSAGMPFSSDPEIDTLENFL